MILYRALMCTGDGSLVTTPKQVKETHSKATERNNITLPFAK